jgi:EAL and modified HD-GYP domain-containing signal transduction protein
LLKFARRPPITHAMAISPSPAPELAASLPVVTRRPVLDRTLRTVAYELIFHERSATFPVWPADLVASRHPAYVDVLPELLLDDAPLPLDPAAVVLELTAGVDIDERLLARLRRLRAQGYQMVRRDAGGRPGPEPLIDVVDAVKFDVLRLGHRETLAELERMQGSGLRVIVEGIDSEDAYEVYRDAGVDLFQGLFYERPNFPAGAVLPVGHGAALGALCQLQLRGGDFEALEQVIRRDVALSFRLLRYVNSAYMGLPRTVGSIREALMLLGTRAVRQWAVALVLAGLEQPPHALLSTALIRARTCEIILAPYDVEVAAHGFTAGMFSLLDAVLGAPMEQILTELPLSQDIALAITEHEGVAGKALEKTIAYERGEFDSPVLGDHSRRGVGIAYNDAVRWADSLAV